MCGKQLIQHQTKVGEIEKEKQNKNEATHTLCAMCAVLPWAERVNCCKKTAKCCDFVEITKKSKVFFAKELIFSSIRLQFVLPSSV